MKILSERVVRTTEEAGWKLNQGSGDREHRESIVFSEPFEQVPVVRVSLAHLDINHFSKGRSDASDRVLNTRVGVEAFNIDEKGFDLVFQTWADTLIAGLGVVWLAYGD